MHSLPPTFWAKLEYDDNDNIVSWHPLIDHCIDVAAVFKAILAETSLRKSLAAIIGKGDLTIAQIDRLAFIAGLHDFGKLNNHFQSRAEASSGIRAGHVREALGLIVDHEDFEEPFMQGLRYAEIDSWGEDDAVCRFLIASVMHHGKLYSIENCSQYSNSSYWRARNRKNPFDELKKITDRLFRLLPNLVSSSTADLLPASPRFQYLFGGLVCLSDWIASDTRFFPFSSESEDRIERLPELVPAALQFIGIDCSEARNFLKEKGYDFNEIFGFSLYEAQQALVDLPFSNESSITIFESATGSGKTEACIARFLKLFSEDVVDGMYFALPTRTAATQIFERINNYIKTTFSSEKERPTVILAVPGYLRAGDMVGLSLPDFQVLWDDSESTGKLEKLRGWAAETPKRYLAGTIVVGTIDQVLLSELLVKHSLLRASALRRLLLVVDEVHASDAYMNKILTAVIKTQVASSGHSILMSATLGCELSEEFLRLCNKESEKISLDDATNKGFPHISYKSVSEKVIHKAISGCQGNKTVRWSCSHYDHSTVARMAIDKAMLGGRVLIIRNTVKDCIATQMELEKITELDGQEHLLFKCNSVAAPHHSRFVADDRKNLDAALEKELGKGSSQRGCIVCATQTVQQSLDIDADLLITDLCPMDVLLQRIGRLHRHVRPDRPKEFLQPVCIVNQPEKELVQIAEELNQFKQSGYVKSEFGFSTVYKNLIILEATRELIASHSQVSIPLMNRELIELSLHSEVLAKIRQNNKHFEEHFTKVEGEVIALRVGASSCLFDWSVPVGNLPTLELTDENIQTRFGEGDRCLVFPSTIISPFGYSFDQIKIPAFMVKGIKLDAELNIISQTKSQLMFSYGAQTFVYDRLGLRPYQ